MTGQEVYRCIFLCCVLSHSMEEYCRKRVTKQGSNIRFCLKIGKTVSETVELLCELYGVNGFSYAQIFQWYACFKDGQDLERLGCLLSVPMSEHIEKVCEGMEKKNETCVYLSMQEYDFGVSKETIIKF